MVIKMVAKIVDGKQIALNLRAEISSKVLKIVETGRRTPSLAVIKVGNDPASSVYVNAKIKACEEVGIKSLSYDLESDVTGSSLLNLIDSLNKDDQVDGILVQLPLPDHLDKNEITFSIDPNKDVDGFNILNMGRLAVNIPSFRPCTPKGIMTMLDQNNIEIEGKHAVIVGSSNIVGRPMALELLGRKATITICHSKTNDLSGHVKQADILVVAVGIPNLIKADWVKPGAVVIDVGINRLDNGKLCGDVDFAKVKKIAGWITPVPGGVGPMTIATLLENTLQAFEKRKS